MFVNITPPTASLRTFWVEVDSASKYPLIQIKGDLCQVDYRATTAPKTPAKRAPIAPTSRGTAPAVEVTVAFEVPVLSEVLVAVPLFDVVSPEASDSVVVAAEESEESVVVAALLPVVAPDSRAAASEVQRLRSDAAMVVPHTEAADSSSALAEAESHEE